MCAALQQQPPNSTDHDSKPASSNGTTADDQQEIAIAMPSSTSPSSQPHQRQDSHDSLCSSGTSCSGIFTADSKAAASSLRVWPNIPFSRTFDFSESYRKSSENDGNSLLTMTQQRPPQRRRCRSSEGMTLRINREEEPFDSTIAESRETSVSPQAQPQCPLNFESELRRRKQRTSVSPEESIGRKRPSQHRRSYSNSLQQQRQERRWWIIPVEHPFKVTWDVLTVILSIANAYLTHLSIRDRKFGPNPFIAFCDTWFLVDILLNFATERRTATGEILRDPRSICARYLTSWFAVDALALFPWESLYVQPLIELQNRRGFFQKSFFRSKAVVRVTRHLRGKHFRWFGTVAKHTKQHGVGAKRLLKLIIKYAPKYVMFLRNMKGIVAMRALRFVHCVRRFITRGGHAFKSDASTRSMSTREDDDLLLDDISSCASHVNNSGSNRNDRGSNTGPATSGILPFHKPVVFVYESEDWEMMDNDDDDDDGVPL